MTLERRLLTFTLLALGAWLASCGRAAPDQRIVLGFSQIGEANEWRKAMKVSWYQGCIREVRFTPRALAAPELQKLRRH